MDRTIWYDIFGDLEEGPVPEQTRARILDIQRQMNRTFTWSGEKLALELFDHSEVTYATDPPVPWAPRHGWGSTKVDFDEWNAALAVRFLIWVSMQLPAKSYVRVCDEGEYIIPGNLLIRHGDFDLDEASIAQWRQYVTRHAPKLLKSLEWHVAAGRNGRWFLPVFALHYQDRPELQKVRYRMSLNKFYELTLEDAADHIVFPWAQRQTKAA